MATSNSKRALDAKKCALLIVDMQKFFVAQAKHIAPRLGEFGRFCLGKGIPVVLTAHHDKPEETTELIKWWGEKGRLEKGTDGWELMDEIAALKGENGVVMLDEKTSYDAFTRTDLEEQLRSKGVEQVIITGTVTNLCCETTARSAYCRNFQVFFLEDLNGTHIDEHHKSTITNLSFGFATIHDEKDAREALSKSN